MSLDAFMPASKIAAHIKDGSIKAESVAAACLARIEALNPSLNAYTDVTIERALEQARGVDVARLKGEALGPLAGVPFAAKNLLDIAGLPTRAGSKINRELPPAMRDAVLVGRLTAAGAVLMGSLNMGEYAYDFTGENAHDGPCRNPHDEAHMAGGSSSGCGAATAAGLAPISLGSDTNGSIRVPSSFCGIFGLKPTYGRLPRMGSFPFCDSLDHLGPFARTVTDLALAYDALQGFDAHDPACAPRPAKAVSPSLPKGVAGLRVAVAGGYFSTGGMPEAYLAVSEVAQALGARGTIEIEGAAVSRAAAFLITNVESAAFHMRRLQTRADDFDPETRDRFLAGAMLPAAWYIKAQQARRWFHDLMLDVFAKFDLIIAPATPCPAPMIGQKSMELRGEMVAVRPNLGLFTQPISCIGLPVAAVPFFGGRLPIGVQLIAAPWREDVCLRAAFALEQAGIVEAKPPR